MLLITLLEFFKIRKYHISYYPQLNKILIYGCDLKLSNICWNEIFKQLENKRNIIITVIDFN